MEEIKTYGVKYIGSKNKLIPSLIPIIRKCVSSVSSVSSIPTIIDVFAGTTRVSQALRAEGWKVIASDLAWASREYAELFLKTTPDELDTLRELASELDRLGDVSVGDDVDVSVGDSPKGWIEKTYCDVIPVCGSGEVVRVWKPENGRRADCIRDTIETWVSTDTISVSMGKKLTAILIMALDVVDSTVGVQQAYLKQWSARSSMKLCLVDRIPPPEWSVWNNPIGEFIGGNVLTIEYPRSDLAYIDPPYTSHPYSTYYHIWDSISRWDKPEVGLKTNRRIDRVARSGHRDESMSSDWNVKRKVVGAFQQLIERLPVHWVVISYSNEAIVSIENVVNGIRELSCIENCNVYSIDHKRNIMAYIGNGEDKMNHADVTEYIIVCEKQDVLIPDI